MSENISIPTQDETGRELTWVQRVMLYRAAQLAAASPTDSGGNGGNGARRSRATSADTPQDYNDPIGTYPTGDEDYDRHRLAFANKALRDECAKIRASYPGIRETTLNTAAFSLYRFVTEDSVIDRGTINDALWEASRAVREPLPDAEIEAKLRHAWRDRARTVRQAHMAHDDHVYVVDPSQILPGGIDGAIDEPAADVGDAIDDADDAAADADEEPEFPPEWLETSGGRAGTTTPEAPATSGGSTSKNGGAGDGAADAGAADAGVGAGGVSGSGKQPALAAFCLTRNQLRLLPDPEPLIADVLDQGTVALLYGPWGSLKTFVALDWACSVATGRPWQGKASERRRVLYVAAEGAYGYKARVQAWEDGWGMSIGEDDLTILPVAVDLTDVNPLVALVGWGGYGLVIIDTLARCMVGADENSAKDCGKVVDGLNQLREATPGARGVILGVHHTGKSGEHFRGSSAFEAAADTIYKVNPVKDEAAVIGLDREKRRDGPTEDHRDLRLDLVGPSGIVVEVSEAEQQTQGTASSGRLMRVYLEHFAGVGCTWTQLKEVADADGIPRTTGYRARRVLLDNGTLINTGTRARPFYEEPPV